MYHAKYPRCWRIVKLGWHRRYSIMYTAESKHGTYNRSFGKGITSKPSFLGFHVSFQACGPCKTKLQPVFAYSQLIFLRFQVTSFRCELVSEACSAVSPWFGGKSSIGMRGGFPWNDVWTSRKQLQIETGWESLLFQWLVRVWSGSGWSSWEIPMNYEGFITWRFGLK